MKYKYFSYLTNHLCQAMAESQRLREAIFHSIEQTSNDLRVQQDATNFDFRKRHYEMKRAKEELEYQMKAVSCLLAHTF